MVATRLLADEIAARGLLQSHRWPLGVDGAQFNPNVPPHPAMATLKRPIQLYVGRVAIEKNLAAFLEIKNKGSKVVVGDGPDLVTLWARFPHATFLGPLHGEALASAYTGADVFVFPSLTDTFGLVNVEALACGLPVAAFPVRGPIDIIGPDGRGVHGGDRPIGALNEDLGRAITLALQADRQACVAEARHYDWETCTDAFERGLVPVGGEGSIGLKAA
jgi:glycosyltransferase involved in cell wall biosynthesis